MPLTPKDQWHGVSVILRVPNDTSVVVEILK